MFERYLDPSPSKPTAIDTLERDLASAAGVAYRSELLRLNRAVAVGMRIGGDVRLKRKGHRRNGCEKG